MTQYLATYHLEAACWHLVHKIAKAEAAEEWESLAIDELADRVVAEIPRASRALAVRVIDNMIGDVLVRRNSDRSCVGLL